MDSKPETDTNKPKKISILRLFLNRFTYVGIILILLSIIIDLCESSIADIIAPYVIKIAENLLSTIGIALFIGAIFDLAKNSEEFITSISHILSDIVISKSFLNTLGEKDKRQALELILQPSGDQFEQYSNINYYFQKKIDEAIGMFDTNFKSHLHLGVKIYKDEQIVKARSNLQYRIYKINNKFQPIQTWFETEGSTIESVKIICDSEVFEIDRNSQKSIPNGTNRTQIPYEKTCFDIPDQFQNAPYVTIQYDIIEWGFNHWINYTWTSLTPYDGLNFELSCENNLIIKHHMLFDNGNGYTVNKTQNNKEISILSTEWLNSYTGISIIIGEKEDAGSAPV